MGAGEGRGGEGRGGEGRGGEGRGGEGRGAGSHPLPNIHTPSSFALSPDYYR